MGWLSGPQYPQLARLRFLNGGVLRNLKVIWYGSDPAGLQSNVIGFSVHRKNKAIFLSMGGWNSYNMAQAAQENAQKSQNLLYHISLTCILPRNCTQYVVLHGWVMPLSLKISENIHQMSTLSNLAYKRDLHGSIWSVLANGKCLNRQGTSATNRVTIQIP